MVVMAKTKWATAIQDKLAARPLRYIDGHTTIVCACENCIGNPEDFADQLSVKIGKKVPLYAVTNYGHTFDHCYVCDYKCG
jgi:hypothetical protein